MLSPIVGVNSSPDTSTTQYSYVSELSLVDWSNSESGFSIRNTVPVSTTLSSLYVQVATAPGSGKSWAFTVMKNGSATTLGVTISDSATSATDSVNTVSFAAGDTISFRSVPSGTPADSGVVRWNIVSDATGQPLFEKGVNSTGIERFYSLLGRGDSLTESQKLIIMPCAGTISKLYAAVSAAPGAGQSKIFTLRVNSTDTALTATIADTNTSANDTANSVSVAAGDLVGMKVGISGGPSSSIARHAVLFTPTVAGNSVLGFNLSVAPSTSVTNYNHPISPGTTWTTTETDRQAVIGSWVIKNFYGQTETASGAGKSYSLTIRKNEANTALTVSCANTTTVQSVTSDVTISQGDKLSLASVPVSSPAGSMMNTGFLLNVPSVVGPDRVAATNRVAVAADKNILFNGDFEFKPGTITAGTTTAGRWVDGTAAGSTAPRAFGWATTPGGLGASAEASFDTTTKRSGAASIRLSNLNTSGTVVVGTYQAASVQQYFSMPSSTSVTLIGYIKTNNVATNAAFIDLREISSSGSTLVTTSSTKLSGTQDWTQVTITVTTNASTKLGAVFLRNNIAGNISDAWFDDITVALAAPRVAASGRGAASGRVPA